MDGPASRFRELLATLSREEFAAFVADLWAARGHDVEREDGVLLADGRDGREVLVTVPDESGTVPPVEEVNRPAPEVVVTAGEPASLREETRERARVLGHAELWELLLYGVPRRAAETAFSEAFDPPLAAVAPEGDATAVDLRRTSPRPPGAENGPAPEDRPAAPDDPPVPVGSPFRGRARTPSSDGETDPDDSRPRTHRPGGDGPRTGPDRTPRADEHGQQERTPASRASGARHPAVVGAAALVVLAAVAAATAVSLLAAPTGGSGDDAEEFEARPLDGSGRNMRPAAPSGGESGGTTPSPAPTPAPTTGPPAELPPDAYPPGVGPAGVTDPTRLGDAHARAVTGRSYRLVLTYREERDGRVTGYRRKTVRVAEPMVFRTETVTAGRVTAAADAVTGVESYADGNVTYYRMPSPGEPEYVARLTTMLPGTVGSHAGGAGRTVAEATSGDRSSVLDATRGDDRTYLWVRFAGRVFDVGTDVRGSLLVDDRGVVHELRYRYVPEDHTDATAEVTVRYEQFGNVTVQPPPWYDEAQRATDLQSASGGE